MSQKKSTSSRINTNWSPPGSRHVESVDYYLDGIKNQDRKVLAEAITYIENNTIPFQNKLQLLKSLPKKSQSIRIGISGSPGVGKSTFINSLGLHLLSIGKKVAVLAVDPSSTISHGSILGDKTRMYDLTLRQDAFIRPSASSNTLGGVTTFTKESILLCEAAGFDVILIETVGVGQSETMVKGLVDMFTLLLLPGAGDELQGIKKGIVEIADLLVINKADGDLLDLAQESKKHYRNAVHLSTESKPIVTCSALENINLDQVWKTMEDYISNSQSTVQFQNNRALQDKSWAALKKTEIFNFWLHHLFEENESEIISDNLYDQLLDYDKKMKEFIEKLKL